MNLKPEDLMTDRVPENPTSTLNATIPELANMSRYEDLMEVDVAEDLKPETGTKFKADLKRWYFRMN